MEFIEDKALRDKYQLVVGLEVHAQLKTRTKAYSNDPNEYGGMPNTRVSPVTLGHPGTLPRVNQHMVEYAIRLGLATHCHIREHMHFARKNYFYPDLPKGYQITQDDTPICEHGYLEVESDGGKLKRIGITRIHMEEDAGKSIHDQDPYHTLVDLNRAGVPLLEIVSEPDIRSLDEAYNYLSEVRRLVRYLEICDGNMEEGSLRCDANVSVMPKGSDKFGNRCEVKNMNSLRNVQRAIAYEAKRHIEILENGGTISQETRSFDAVKGTTFSLRTKEEAHDYRYFPEPDLLPLKVTQKEIDDARRELPPLPRELFEKYTKELNLSSYDSAILTEDKETALYFEELISHTNNYKAAANWIITDVKGYLNQQALHVNDFPLKPQQIAALIAIIDEGQVSHSVASQNIFPAMIESPEKDPIEIAKERDLIQQRDTDFIENLAREAISKYPDKAEAYRQGNKGLLGLFMGEVMKLSERKADPKAANQVLRKILEEE